MMNRSSAGLVIALVALSGCGKAKNRARVHPERLPRVEVIRPQRTTLLRKIELAATVEPLQRVELFARVPGTVEYLPRTIDIGRRVRKGEKLVQLAVPDLEADRMHKEALAEQARKQAIQAERAVTVARREVDEARQQEKRYAAEQEFYKSRHDRIAGLVRMEAQERQLAEEALKQVESAAAAYKAATAMIGTREAKVLAAEAEFEVAGRKVKVADAEVKKVVEWIGFATITAPMDGVITRRWVDPGATIKDAGAPLLTLMQLDRVRVLIDIPQREVSLVNTEEDEPVAGKKVPADSVVIQLAPLAEVVRGGEFKGTIARMSRALDPVTRTMRAEVELDNSRGNLKAGMYGKAQVLLEERPNVLTVPATALVRRYENLGVYVVANARGVPPRGVLKFVELKLGLDDGRQVEVSGGLQGDELVVAKGNGVLRVDDEVLALPQQEE